MAQITGISWCDSTAMLKAFYPRAHPLCYSISAEPLIEAIDPGLLINQLGWVVAGGESGDKARSIGLEPFKALAQSCARAGVPYHQKQLSQADFPHSFKSFETFPREIQIRQFAGGRSE